LRRFSLAVVFSLAACATASAPGLSNGPAIQPVLFPNERALAFSLEAPGEDATGPNLRLWATHYHTPEITPAAASISAAFPLIGRDGAPMLSAADPIATGARRRCKAHLRAHRKHQHGLCLR